MVFFIPFTPMVALVFTGPLKLNSFLELMMLFQELSNNSDVWSADFVVFDDRVLSIRKIVIVFQLHKECEIGQNESWSSAGRCIVVDIDDIALLKEVIKMLCGMEQLFNIFIIILVLNWVTYAIENTDFSIFTTDPVPFNAS